MGILTEVESTGKTWLRSNKITISNELDKIPSITWEIEKAIEIAGETVTKALPAITVIFDQKTSVPIRNPLTGELTGQSMTKGEIYALIYSAFWVDAVAAGVIDAGKL